MFTAVNPKCYCTHFDTIKSCSVEHLILCFADHLELCSVVSTGCRVVKSCSHVVWTTGIYICVETIVSCHQWIASRHSDFTAWSVRISSPVNLRKTFGIHLTLSQTHKNVDPHIVLKSYIFQSFIFLYNQKRAKYFIVRIYP